MAKNKRNFWPLMISGLLSGLLVLGAGIFSYRLYQQFVKPFDPIVQAAKTQKTLQTGSKLYTNPLGFSMTLHDGTVMSDWIHIEDWSFLVGLDSNMFLTPNDSTANFALYALGHETDDEPESAHRLMQEVAQAIGQAHSPKGRIEIDQILPVEMGNDAEADLLQASIYPYQPSTPPLAFSLLIVTKGHDTFFLGGLGNQNNESIHATISSFTLAQ